MVGEGPEKWEGALEVGKLASFVPPLASPGMGLLEGEVSWIGSTFLHSPLPLQEASLRFTLPCPGAGTEGPAKQENFILGSCR